MKNIIALAVLACAVAANAVPTMFISDGLGDWIKIEQGGSVLGVGYGTTTIDTSTPGMISYSGTIGNNWTVNLTTGSTKPITGSPEKPYLDLNSVNLSSGAGDLYVFWSDTGFGPSSGTVLASISGTINGAPGSTLGYSTYADLKDQARIMGELLTSQSFSAGAFSGNASGVDLDTLGSPYSLTQFIAVHHDEAGSTSYHAILDPPTTVPDGGLTLALLGFALTGVEGLRRKLSV